MKMQKNHKCIKCSDSNGTEWPCLGLWQDLPVHVWLSLTTAEQPCSFISTELVMRSLLNTAIHLVRKGKWKTP